MNKSFNLSDLEVIDLDLDGHTRVLYIRIQGVQGTSETGRSVVKWEMS
jgi:hypothetical protein